MKLFEAIPPFRTVRAGSRSAITLVRRHADLYPLVKDPGPIWCWREFQHLRIDTPEVMPSLPRVALLRLTIPYKNKLLQAGVFLRFREDLRRSATSGP